MLVCAAVETPRLYEEDGLLVFGSELSHPGLAYFMVNRDPDAGHYVELFDQVFGRFGRLRRIDLADDKRSLLLALTYDVNGLGSDFRVTFAEPISEQSAQWLWAFNQELAENP